MGYSADQLRDHVEAHFTGDMSWEAFAAGRIHLARVIALRWFDLSSECAVRAAWRLENLRPLWRGDNLAKHQSMDATAPIRIGLEARIAEYREARKTGER